MYNIMVLKVIHLNVNVLFKSERILIFFLTGAVLYRNFLKLMQNSPRGWGFAGQLCTDA